MPFPASVWTRHVTGLNIHGRPVCTRCGIETPSLIPVQQIVCTKEDRLFLGTLPEAVDCHAL